jgi:hypothetical protein
VTDLTVAGITALLASTAVGLKLAVEEILFQAHALAAQRARAVFLRTHARNRATLEAYAEVHGWATVFPLCVIGELRGLELAIAQTGGSSPRTRITAEGAKCGQGAEAVLAARLSRLPGARASLIAPGRVEIEWIAELADPGALDLAIDALIEAAASPLEGAAYREGGS